LSHIYTGIVFCLIGIFNDAYAQELYRVRSLPCNTPDKNEFSALPYGKGLIFCSDRPDMSAIKFETTKGAKSLVNLFVIENDSATKAISSPDFSSIYAHDGPIAFYDNGNRAVLTRTLSDKNKFKSIYKDTKLGLFFFEKREGKWRESGSFPFNDLTYSCGQATINEQGTVMIFSSDMPGSNGGTDLYYSTFNHDDSSWILPVNLGSIINSSKNEMFPFLHPSGILYYSSAGKKGKGGLDIFHTAGGYPYSRIVHEVDEVNSDKDDFGFWASPDFSKGYMTSNREGSDDIYSVSLTPPKFENCVDYEDISYCYEFFEEASIDVDTIPMVYEWDFGDGITKKGLSAYHCYKAPGTYIVQLNVFDTVVNALFMNEARYEMEIADKNQPLIAVPDSANPNKPFYVSAGQARFKDFVIGEYYWDFGDGLNMKGERFPVTLEKAGEYEVILGVTSVPDKNGRSQSRCFKTKLIVSTDSIPPQLVDDSSDPANEKLPGGTQGTTFVLVEDTEGFHITKLKGDGTNISGINQLPNSVYYLKLDANGDTLVKKHSTDPATRKLLETYLDQAEAPFEVRKDGLVSNNAFLPNDSLKYPVYGLDIKKFYGTIDSLVKSPWQFTVLPANIAEALRNLNSQEAGLNTVNNKNNSQYLPQYNANINVPNDSTVVFHKQVTNNPDNANLINTTQYDTVQHKDVNNNSNQNNNVQNNTNSKDTTRNNANTNNAVVNNNSNQNNNVQNNSNAKDTTRNNANTNNTVVNNNVNQNNNVQNNTNSKDTTRNNANTNNAVVNNNSNQNNNVQNNTNAKDTTRNNANANNTVVNNNASQNNNSQNNTVVKDTANNNSRNNTVNNTIVKDTSGVQNSNTVNNNTVVKDTMNNNSHNNANVKDTTNDQQTVNNLNILNNGWKEIDSLKPNNDWKEVDSLRPSIDTIDITLEDLLKFTHTDLEYKVQIGAYRFPKNFKYDHLKKLGKKDEQLLIEGITRITLGRFKTMKEAYEFRNIVRKEGINDAFVTAVFNGKRYYLYQLKELLKAMIPVTTN
jgi:PKD domain/WD40-like Beta Propeller Repeat